MGERDARRIPIAVACVLCDGLRFFKRRSHRLCMDHASTIYT